MYRWQDHGEGYGKPVDLWSYAVILTILAQKGAPFNFRDNAKKDIVNLKYQILNSPPDLGDKVHT